ncbi:MAG TPA: GTP 3',8-cyclase MoaA [Flavobacteriales bacterium]|nr:GTP 3',8-cyclase MoaA [Flavobacteriales bacterium]HQW30826.1 GTP 3',8-cyclase MoaA [Flavobacteriales bacterium]HQY01501.1 GTP 3',8-cyclase MoaA [Flavobacteriales bacterium]HQY78963.1 GTP 3',8-cyclase MoaA [Flavobacteriales bacterium]HRA15509.1 GTP 3',8-cyclase MoaA [Flavobacteriales bacterium]
MTLLTDRYSRTHRNLRISIVDKCDLRCTYCMPEDQQFLKRDELMTREEIRTLAKLFVEQYGITKIRLTGGEPLMRPDVVDLVRDMAQLPVKLGLTTNATRLHLFLDQLISAGLKSVNISLDTFDAERFRTLSRRDGHDRVLANIEQAIDRGLHVKLNMVVMRGVNDDELLRFTELTRDRPVHVRFIEFMPFAGNLWGRERVYTYSEMLGRIGSAHTIEKLDDDPHSTAKAYRVKGWQGTFAVISTVTEPFCGNCDRLRLTAEGKLRNCLFAREETDLLSALRSGEDVSSLIEANVLAKHKMLGGLPQFNLDKQEEVLHDLSSRPMVSIGG